VGAGVFGNVAVERRRVETPVRAAAEALAGVDAKVSAERRLLYGSSNMFRQGWATCWWGGKSPAGMNICIMRTCAALFGRAA
jgi:hypothetical protein